MTKLAPIAVLFVVLAGCASGGDRPPVMPADTESGWSGNDGAIAEVGASDAVGNRLRAASRRTTAAQVVRLPPD